MRAATPLVLALFAVAPTLLHGESCVRPPLPNNFAPPLKFSPPASAAVAEEEEEDAPAATTTTTTAAAAAAATATTTTTTDVAATADASAWQPSPSTRVLKVRHQARPGAPPPFQEAMTTEVFVIGTAHVSSRSCEEVTSLIQHVKPDVVLVELCTQRLAMLSNYDGGDESKQQLEQQEKKEEEDSRLTLSNVRRNGGIGSLLLWMQARSARALHVQPGEEMRCALREARRLSRGGGGGIGGGEGANGINGKAASSSSKQHKCDFYVCDRPCAITLRRLFDSLKRWQKVRLIASVIWSGIFVSPRKMKKWLNRNLDDGDSITDEILKLGKSFPSVVATLIYERDCYMVRRVRECVILRRPRRAVVVVGAGHVNGMADHWEALVNNGGNTNDKDNNSGQNGPPPDDPSSPSFVASPSLHAAPPSSFKSFDPSGDFSQSSAQQEQYSVMPVCVNDDMLRHVASLAAAKPDYSAAVAEPFTPLRFMEGERVLVWNGEGLPQRGQVLRQWFTLSEEDQAAFDQDESGSGNGGGDDGGARLPETVAYLVNSEHGVLAVPVDDEGYISRDDFLADMPTSPSAAAKTAAAAAAAMEYVESDPAEGFPEMAH